MLRSLLVLVCAASLACLAQTSAQQPAARPPAASQAPQAAPKPTAAPATDSSAAVAPAQPVITVKGVCSSAPVKKTAGGPAPKAAATACETVVTKADFERLLNALNSSNQNIPTAMRRNLAQAYVEFLSFAQAAHKAGLDKDPRFLEIMKLMRMRTLEDIYRRNLEEKYRTPAQPEIQEYYNKNLLKYDELKLSRIFIPAKNTAAAEKDDWEKKAAQTANDIHDRAAKGEEFDKLQKDAYTTLGLTISPPNTIVGTRRRGMMAPAEEQELFALKAGDVSKVEQEPAGYIIYKLDSRQTLPLDQVKDEISRELFRQKMEAGLKSVTSNVQAEFNDQYFGPATQTPPPPGARIGGQPPNAPPVKPASQPSSPPPSSGRPPDPNSPPATSPVPPAQKPPE